MGLEGVSFVKHFHRSSLAFSLACLPACCVGGSAWYSSNERNKVGLAFACPSHYYMFFFACHFIALGGFCRSGNGLHMNKKDRGEGDLGGLVDICRVALFARSIISLVSRAHAQAFRCKKCEPPLLAILS